MSDSAILVEGLAKRFGDVVALDGIDFKVPAGTVFGLLGPNGAGKTTLMKLITHVGSPDRGRIEYHSPGGTVVLTKHSPDAIARMGVVKTNQVIQDFESLTIRESLLLSLASAEGPGVSRDGASWPLQPF